MLLHAIYYLFSASRAVHHRAESPTPSCVSMKSDTSKAEPLNFSNEAGPPHTQYVTIYMLYKLSL